MNLIKRNSPGKRFMKESLLKFMESYRDQEFLPEVMCKKIPESILRGIPSVIPESIQEKIVEDIC